jgi:hypothetical protein
MGRDKTLSRNADPQQPPFVVVVGRWSLRGKTMLAIAGAILMHAACVLLASGKDTIDIYLSERLLMAMGSMLIASDLTIRVREFLKKAKASIPLPPPAR